MAKSWKMSKKEMLDLLADGPKICEAYNSIECQHKLPANTHKDVKKAIAIARKFNNEVLRPMYLEMDLKCMEDHDYVPWEFVKKAGDWGLYTLFVPRIFGGQHLSFVALFPFIEEIASVCSGLGHIIFVHYLGIATLFPSFNARLMNIVMRDVRKSEKEGTPRLLDLVITEPSAGTDVQEPILFDHARVETIAKKVDGGYVFNGKKIFISNGHLSHWHIVMGYEDRKRTAETMVQAVIQNGTKGFSFGAKEKKMGNLASTASELIFDECFVPDKWISFAGSQPFAAKSKKGSRWITHTFVDYVVSSSRAGVGAIATGVGRSAYERALDYARHKQTNGDLLINQQWAQIILTDMYRNVNMSRTLYMENNYADMISGLFKLLNKKPVVYIQKLPEWYFKLISPILRMNIMTWFFRKYYYDWYTEEERNCSTGWGSIAKYSCSDFGLVNANLALDLMGADGLRHDKAAEKCFRDVKLQQIYESTNQINQMNIFCSLIGYNLPEVEFFK